MLDILKDIIDYIDLHDISDIYDLLSVQITENKRDWNKILSDDKILDLFDSYIKKVRSERNLQLIKQFYQQIQNMI